MKQFITYYLIVIFLVKNLSLTLLEKDILLSMMFLYLSAMAFLRFVLKFKTDFFIFVTLPGHSLVCVTFYGCKYNFWGCEINIPSTTVTFSWHTTLPSLVSVEVSSCCAMISDLLYVFY